MCREKKVEEELPVNEMYKEIPITATRVSTEQFQQQENWDGKKNNGMDISRDKQSKFHTRTLGLGWEKETLREKLNLF